MLTVTRELLPRRLAAVAPERPERKPSDGLESEVYAMCVTWAAWCATRGRYGAPREPGSIMGQLLRVHSTAGDERSARCDQSVATFNHHVINHPAEIYGEEDAAICRQVFEAHFLRRKRNIKLLAFEHGINRRRWYRIVNAFARAIYRQWSVDPRSGVTQ